MLGTFRLVEPIGRGGMGEVYKAEQALPAGGVRRAAVKRILPRFQQDPTLRARFVAEARINARLEHPNVVQVLDFGDQPEPWLALEYVEGTSVARVLKQCADTRTRLPPAVAAYIIAEAASGLDYAHRRCDEAGQPLQIIHRDVSPQNVLLGVDGSVKISDFGIARAADNQHRTAAGMAVGKLAYMAPEQVAGRAFDWRVDVFALGVLLWETLLVRPLIPRNDSNAAMQILINGRFDPPTRVDPSLPPLLDQIVMGALAVDPNQRTQSAGLLAQQLKTLIQQIQPGFDGRALASVLSRTLPDLAWRTGALGPSGPEAAPVRFGAPTGPRPATLPPPTAGGLPGIAPVGAAPLAPSPGGFGGGTPGGALPGAGLPGLGGLPPMQPMGPSLSAGPVAAPLAMPTPGAPAAEALLPGMPPAPPKARYDLPSTQGSVDVVPALQPRPSAVEVVDPRRKARILTAVIVLAMVLVVGLIFWWVVSTRDEGVVRRTGGAVVSVSGQSAVPALPAAPAPAAVPSAPTPAPRVQRDFTPLALAALGSREAAVMACLRQREFRNLAEEATTGLSFDNANGTVREVEVRYRNQGRRPVEALTRCLDAAVRPARFTADPPEAGITRVERGWPMGRALNTGGGGGQGMSWPFSTPR
ncbi:MAG: protein kinase [Myxococcales bacterium]|nr:protein kinase [Myxococcales bacterium]